MNINRNRRVYVHKNSRKNTFSIIQDRRVIGYANEIALKKVRFLVSKAGRKKHLTKTDNGHAGVSGYVDDQEDFLNYQGYTVGYDATICDSFLIKETLGRVEKAPSAFLSIEKGIFIPNV